MIRGTRRVAPLLLAVLVLGLLVAPARASADSTHLGPVGPSTRCVEPGAGLELPPIRWVGEDGPMTGRLVRWEYRTDTTVPYTATEPVALDEHGVAAPPTVDAAVPAGAHVWASVQSGERWVRVGHLVVYRAARSALLRDATVQVDPPHEKTWSRGVHVSGLSPLHEVTRADGGCAEAPADDVELEVWATHGVTDERSLLGRVDVERRTWGVQTFLPTTGAFHLTVEQVRDGARIVVPDDETVTVVRDTTRLHLDVPRGVTWTTAPAGHPTWWMPRGARFRLGVVQTQDEWRPAALDGSPRTVGLRFTPAGSTTARPLADMTLVREEGRRSGVQEHVLRERGRFSVAFAGTATETASRASLDVRLMPRISFPTRTTTARAFRPFARTVTIRDAAGLKAGLEYKKGSGWEPTGHERTVPTSGKVRLVTPNDTRRTRTYRVVVWAPSVGGGLEPVVASRGTWTVRNR